MRRVTNSMILKGLGVFLMGAGIATTVYFSVFRSPKEHQMGYSSGKGCFDGECGHKGTLAACIACCGERCPQYALDCGDLCLEKFDPGSAQTEMGKAALRIGAKDAADYVGFCRDVQMLKVLQRSKNHRVSRMARALAREASEQSGLNILVSVK